MGDIITNPPTTPNTVSDSWQPLVDRDTMSYFGKNKITLTNWDATTTAPAIAQGSTIDIDGSIARFTADEAIGGAPADGTVYLMFVVSGATVTAEWTAEAPTWTANKGGWYTAAGNRCSGHLMIKSGTSYTYKRKLSDLGEFVSIGPAGFGLELILSPGANVVMSDDTINTSASGTPEKLKSLTCTARGTYTTTHTMRLSNVTTGTAYSAIYKNGAQVGPTNTTTSNTPTTYTYNITLEVGDTCELWAWAAGTGARSSVEYFRMKIADTLSDFTKLVLGFYL